MKLIPAALGLFCVLSLLSVGTAAADVSKDEKNLAREAKRVNDTAAKPDGEKAVAKRLVVDLKAEEQQVQLLRDRKLGYGEAAIVLALAQAMPGGTTNANVQQVLALHEGPPAAGWGDVARKLGLKLGKIVSQVRKVANNANREIKKDHARVGTTPKEAPAEQNTAPQGPAKQEYKGEGRLLRQGGSAQ
jgi:hypothetical protein